MSLTGDTSGELEEIVRQSPAICFTWLPAPGWPVLYVSDNVRRFGYEPEEFVAGGRTYASIIHPDDLSGVQDEVLRHAVDPHDEFTQEYRIMTADGETRWVDDRTRVQRDANGMVTRVQGVVLDITPHKQFDAKLAHARDELSRALHFTESLLEAIPTPVFFKDCLGRYVGCNRAFSEVMGVLPEDINGKTVHECWPGEFADVYHQHDLELMARPHLQVYEAKVIDREGMERSVIYAKNVYFDETDRVAGIVGAFIDISDRKKMEVELRYRLEFERVVMQISTEFVGRHPDDMGAGIDAGLEALGEATGVERAYVFELRGAATKLDATHEWCRPGVASQMQRLQGVPVAAFPSLNEYIPQSQAAAMARVAEPVKEPVEPSAVWVETIRSLLMLPMICAGRVVGFLGIDAMRADRPWSEDDLSLLRVAGEIFANGLGRRQAESQLREAQKLESVGRLAAGVAHDLNNMLTPILGFAQLLRVEMTDSPSALEDLGEIIHAAERSRDLVRQLLAFSRKQILDLKLVELPAVVCGMEKLVRSALRENIDLRIIAPAANRLLYADSGQLEQVILNLAMNAQDAMPHGGTLLIETAEADLDETYCADHSDVEPGSYAMLAISDTGVGMDEQTREHLFEPFFTTKQPGAGTGLGLATVYGIVRQHGGSIWLYSEPGKGTTFKIYLPAADRAALLADAATTPHEAPSVPGSVTIAVVEDDRVVRRLVTSVLTQAGCKIISAASGHECLELLEQHEGPVDLLLTDVIMEDLDGHQLHEEILRRFPHRLGAMKVLFMSGYTHNVIAHHGVLDEGINFIQKPFAVERLVEKVREVLGDTGN
jgi:PAS domain S-box-containing protein